MSDDKTIALPRTRREFRDWLRAAGFPKRLCERVAAAFPGDEELEDNDGSQILGSIQELTQQLRGDRD